MLARSRCWPILFIALFAGCQRTPEQQVLGTLEWDRVELVATAAEPVTAIAVREGDQVAAGALVVEQRADRAEADIAVAEAELERTKLLLVEQQAGARPEQRRESEARTARARAALSLASDELARGLGLKTRGLISAAELDRLEAARALANSELAAARANQDLVLAGTRGEAMQQSAAGITAAERRVDALRLTRERLRLLAPTDARVESLPLEVGDTPAVGATVATLLVGKRPYARVYLPAPIRAASKIGSRFDLRIEGRAAPIKARLRMVAAQSSFTPYYALSGDDANRLSFLAELELEGDGLDDLAAGLPVQATPTQ